MTSDRYNRYQVIAKLGEGGMSTVFLAYDPRMDRRIALKVLSPAFLADPTFPQRFDQEVKIIARLEHPAIIPVYDYGQDHGCPYLVMRLMTGGSLNDRLKRGALSLDEAKAVMNRICGALAKAHSKKIIHRDLKPGNILFDADGNAYLADFGIARLAAQSQTVTIMGTPQYMAPEQALGHGLDARTDVYQMGIVLYEMLTGEVPFDAATPPALLYAHAHSPIPRPTSRRPTLPPVVDAIIERALAKDPGERFSTIKDLNRAVSGLQPGAGGTILADTRAIHRPVGAEVAKRIKPRKRLPTWLRVLVALVALALIATLVAGAFLGPRVYDAITGRIATPTADLTATAQQAAALAAQIEPTATDTPSPTIAPSITPSPTLSPTASPTATDTPAPTPSPTASRTKIPSPTPIQSPTVTETPTATEPPTATATVTQPATGGGEVEPTPVEPTVEPSEEPAGTGAVQSGVYYLFYQGQQWNSDAGLWENGFYVLDLVALNTVTFIKTNASDLHSIFDYDDVAGGATRCNSPGGQYELVVQKVREYDQLLIQFRIEADGSRGFIYEWDPGVNYLQLWCLNDYFIVSFPNDTICRGNYGESVHPWFIGVPDNSQWWIGRAW
jgi:serine/threonine-protein kinase